MSKNYWDYSQEMNQMCNPGAKKEHKTKIERLIEALDRLSDKLDREHKPADPAEKLKDQVDRLEKIIG